MVSSAAQAQQDDAALRQPIPTAALRAVGNLLTSGSPASMAIVGSALTSGGAQSAAVSDVTKRVQTLGAWNCALAMAYSLVRTPVKIPSLTRKRELE